MVREHTRRILYAVEQGLINKDQLILDMLNWLSEDEVRQFAETQGFDDEDDEEDEEDGYAATIERERKFHEKHPWLDT